MKKEGFRVIVLVIMIAMLAGVVSAGSNYSVNETHLEQNTTFMNRNDVERYNAASNSNMQVTLDINEENECAVIKLDHNGKEYIINAEGHIQHVSVGGLDGSVGTFEGHIFPFADDLYFKSFVVEDKPVSIIADVTYTDSDMFTSITVGVISDSTDPEILYFGDYTDDIRLISQQIAYSTLTSSEQSVYIDQPTYDDNISTTSVQAETTYQGRKEINYGGIKFGEISAFHADQLGNQATMSVYAKVNGDRENLSDYVHNVLGYTTPDYAIHSYVDTVDISIGGRHVGLHNTGVYIPVADVDSYTIPIYAYLGSILGVQSIDVTITTGRVDVETSRYGLSVHPDNIVSWEIYRDLGLPVSGSYSTYSGVGVRALYIMEANNITSSFNAHMQFVGALQFKCVATDVSTGEVGDVYRHTIKTDDTILNTTVEIIP